MLKKLLLLTALLVSFTALPAEEATNYVKEKILAVSLSTESLIYNPLESYSATEAQLYSALYEGLVTYHPFTLDPLPGVARRWEVSEDGRTYRFYLRPEARYWNGDLVTAGDFRETWLMLLDPRRNAPYSFLLDGIKGARDFRTGLTAEPEDVGIRVEGDHVFVVELEEPSDPFLKILCHHSFVPLHPRIRDLIGEGSPAPGLGNGPFFLFESSGEGMVFRKNELYWDRKNVDLREIRFVFLDDDQTAAELFNRGDIHWSMGNIDINQVENRGAITLNPLFATTYYYFTSQQEPYADPRVRQALALLIPWEEIRSEEVYYTPATTLVPPLPGYPAAEPLNSTDEEKAWLLLEEAGYPQGKGLPPLVLLIPQGGENSPAVRTLSQSWKEKLQGEVEVRTLPARTYYQGLEAEEYTLGTLTWIGDFADPLTFLQMWASDSNLNSGGFQSEEYDELMSLSGRQTGDARMKTLARAEELLLQEAVVLPISHQPALNVVAASLLEGWYPNPLDIHPFKYISFYRPEIPPNVVQTGPLRFDLPVIFRYN